jgi:hypothetical protein
MFKVLLVATFEFEPDWAYQPTVRATFSKEVEMPAPPMGLQKVSAKVGEHGMCMWGDVESVGWSEPRGGYIVHASSKGSGYLHELLGKDAAWKQVGEAEEVKDEAVEEAVDNTDE